MTAQTDHIQAHVHTASAAVRALLNPRSVVLVGVSADQSKFSGQPLRNLQDLGFPGVVHPVNRRGGRIRGVAVTETIDAVEGDVDVGFIMVPARDSVAAVLELGRKGAVAAVVAVSGFGELGTDEGRDLQQQLAAAGRAAGVRLLGPNCNGLYHTRGPVPLGYNKIHSVPLKPGNVALVSHSGAMLGSFAPVLERYGAGLSVFVSCGNEVDLSLDDFVDYFVADPGTQVITLILDGVQDGPRFRRAARAAAINGKAVVALKLGNSTSGTSAAQAHSSRLAGARAIYEAVFAADGVVSVPTVETLALAGAILGSGRRPSVRSVVAASTSGAGGVLLADLLSDYGIEVPALDPATVRTMSAHAGFAQVLNPFDIGAAGPTGIDQHLAALATDPAAGCLLFFLAPTPTEAWRLALAGGLAAVARNFPTTPVIVVSPSAPDEVEMTILGEAGIPVVSSMIDAVCVVRALAVLAPSGAAGGARDVKRDTLQPVGRTLSEPESKALLRGAGVPFLPETVAATASQAAEFAASIGYPVVLKAAGGAIAHKSEHGLVLLNITDEASLRTSFGVLEGRALQLDSSGYQGVLVTRCADDGVDVVVGTTRDRDFGPMVVMGAGGIYTELFADVAIAPAPTSPSQARALIGRTGIAKILAGSRGHAPADIDALVDIVVRVSRFADEHAAAVVAVDLNPIRVFAQGRGAVGLDALVVVDDATTITAKEAS